MATIEKHIFDLLHYHDCVIVPGLGGFVANLNPILLQKEKNLFIPPAKEIGFNRSLIYNDGLLTNYVASKKGVSYSEAQELINDFVTNIRSRIILAQAVILDKIGTLRADAIGNLQFSPSGAYSFLPEAFGLSSFRIEPADYKYTVKFEKEILRSVKWNKQTMRYWSSVAALITVLFFLSTTELKMPSVSLSGWSTPNLSIEKTKETTVSDNNFVLAEAQDSADDISSPLTELIDNKEPTEEIIFKKYSLIAASLVKRDAAEKSLQTFIHKGHKGAAIVDDEPGRFRIALEFFDTKAEAIRVMEDYRLRPGFETVWVYTLKNSSN